MLITLVVKNKTMGVLNKLKGRMAGVPQRHLRLAKKRRDTIRVGSNYKVGDVVEEYELENAIKKQTGDFPQLSVQDYSTVKRDKKGNYVISDE